MSKYTNDDLKHPKPLSTTPSSMKNCEFQILKKSDNTKYISKRLRDYIRLAKI